MIKNKKYKGFSLIEAMVLFTALSLVLLAFLPIMLKRPEKVTDSDCVGGLRSVRQEFNVGQYDIRISDRIASEVTVTLVGAGAGGQNGVAGPSEKITGTRCELILPAKTDKFFYRNVWISAVNKGFAERKENCSKKAGNSGYSYANNRYMFGKCKPLYNTSSNYKTVIDTERAEDDETEERIWLSASVCMYDSRRFNPSEKYHDFIFKRTLGETKKEGANFYGGVPTIHMTYEDEETNEKVLAGVGESCILEDGEYKQTQPTKGMCEIKYEKVFLGTGGGAGGYLKFAMALGGGSSCSITVGEGGKGSDNENSSERNGEDTTFSCDGGSVYKATGAHGDNDGSYVTYKKPILRSLNMTTEWNNPSTYGSDSIAGGFGRGIALTDYDVNQISSDKYLAFNNGTPGGCSRAMTSFDCIDPNGKPGYLGSGGGGGSCNETSCGKGGKGGDGLAVIEYLEYCK